MGLERGGGEEEEDRGVREENSGWTLGAEERNGARAFHLKHCVRTIFTSLTTLPTVPSDIEWLQRSAQKKRPAEITAGVVFLSQGRIIFCMKIDTNYEHVDDQRWRSKITRSSPSPARLFSPARPPHARPLGAGWLVSLVHDPHSQQTRERTKDRGKKFHLGEEPLLPPRGAGNAATGARRNGTARLRTVSFAPHGVCRPDGGPGRRRGGAAIRCVRAAGFTRGRQEGRAAAARRRGDDAASFAPTSSCRDNAAFGRGGGRQGAPWMDFVRASLCCCRPRVAGGLRAPPPAY